MKPVVALETRAPLTSPADTLLVCVTTDDLATSATVRALDAAFDGGLLRHAKAVSFRAKAEQVLDVPSLGRVKARRVMLVGLGPTGEVSAAKVRAALAGAMRTAAQSATHVAVVMTGAHADPRVIGEAIGLGAYRFTKYLTGERRPKTTLEKVSVLRGEHASPTRRRVRGGSAGAGDRGARAALAAGVRVAQAVRLARDAINEPPNVVVPATLARIARDLARTHGFRVKILDKAGIKAAGMNLHYAVGQGSANEPRFIHLTYRPRGKARGKLVFVGKGLTFDSGGLCIKPAPGMGDMKSDMSGAAAVLGMMDAVGALRPAVEIHGIVGAAENMPDGAAYRPADVFTSLDGKTVEIINTDAEGRLVLADALCYATRLKPDLIVDAATLTGAALVALGKMCSAFYATSDAQATAFAEAARRGRGAVLAHAAARRAEGAAEERRRRPEAHRRSRRRLDHRGVVPARVRRSRPLDPLRHRGPGAVRARQRHHAQGRHRPRRADLRPADRTNGRRAARLTAPRRDGERETNRRPEAARNIEADLEDRLLEDRLSKRWDPICWE